MARPRHLQLNDKLNDLRNAVNRQNFDVAIRLLDWTEKKIGLATQERDRAHLYRLDKTKGRVRRVVRGDVYYAYLGENVGSEQNKYRPVVVVQNRSLNSTSPTVIVCPLTDLFDNAGNRKRTTPNHIEVHHPSLKKPSVIKTEYVRTISKNRLLNHICRLDITIMADVDQKLKLTLSLT